MKRKLSLRWYLSFHLGLSLMVQCVVMALFAWHLLLPRIRTEIDSRNKILANTIAENLAAHAMGGERQLRALADYLENHTSLVDSDMNSLLDSHCGHGELFEAIYLADYQNELIDAAGLVTQRRSKREDLIGLDISGRGFLKVGRSLEKPYWSETFLSTSIGRMAVAVTIPMRQDAIVGEIGVDRLSSLITRLPMDSFFWALILDHRGRIIADSQRDLAGQYFDRRLLSEIGFENGFSPSIDFELDGERWVGTIVQNEQLGWKVVVAQSHWNVYQPIRSIFLTIIMGLFVAILLALTMAWMQAKKISRNFNTFSDQAQSIAQGNYDIQPPPTRTREFAKIVEALQQMAQRIGQRERQIVEKEYNLKITLDSIGDAVIATDLQGAVTRMNPRAECLTGWSFAHAAGKHLSEVFHIFDSRTRHAVLNPVERVITEGNVVGLANHTVLISKYGREYQIADSAAPIRQADGGIMGVVLVFRDVTDLYAKEQQIRESEMLLKRLTDNVPGVVFQVRVKQNGSYSLDFINQQIFNILGLEVSRERLLSAFIERIPEEDKESLKASITSAVEEVQVCRWEGRFNKPSGESVWFEISGICQKEEADVIFYGILTDASERKRWGSALQTSERRFKDLFNEAPVMYVITDISDQQPCIIDVNNLFLRTLGYERSEVIGTFLPDYYSEETRRRFMESADYQSAIKGETFSEEREMITKDGRSIHALLSKRPEHSVNGTVTGLRAMFLDITSRKNAEKERQRLAAALLQSQKMEAIGTLAGGIAHDFNNILSGVMGYSELSLKEVQNQPRLHHNLKQILKAGLRARDLVQQILTFSRQKEDELTPLQIGPLIKEALKLLRSSIPMTIEIRQQIDPNLDFVMGDPTQIHRIIMNLCTNAAHAMEEHGGQLTVSLSPVALTEQDNRLHPGLKPGPYLKLSIQDTGHGISAENIPKIFDPYFSTKSKEKGTGLGLSVVHGIINNYGGSILVYSEPGRGTLFNAYIPSMKLERANSPTQEETMPMGSEHILLIDDEPVLIEVGQMMLEMLGYKVTACDSSLSAWDVFSNSPGDIDLVISDVTMPKMTGDRLAREMLRVRPDLPIILCTGFSDKVNNKSVAEIGVKAVIMKPFVQKDLALLVGRILDKARATG